MNFSPPRTLCRLHPWRVLLLLMAVWFGGLPASADPQASQPPATAGAGIDWQKERSFWSFHPPQSPPVPVVRDSQWLRQPLDRFILARLESRGLAPAAPALKRTWIRRVTLDLTGIGPTPEEVDAFLSDNGAHADADVVDRLLASPRFGERMASLWLPLARYAEDQAHQVGEDTTYFYANAWHYRDWVIQAFNRDVPYDRFLRLQLAADRFPDAGTNELAALGFLGLGPKYYDRKRLTVQADEWEDRIDTVCRTMLGLTVACARCHDHKFEPITQEDYYALAGIFASTRMLNQAPDGTIEKEGTPAPKIRADTLHIIAEGSPTNLNVFLRGNADNLGPLVGRRFLNLLSEQPPRQFVDGSGRRELAEAIAGRENPLTARVMVNRIWGHLMGEPLVPTSSNFGHSGIAPENPELLDDLAVRFMEHGWSVKSLIRELALSATYRQGSSGANGGSANAHFASLPRRRMSIEQWRDTVLQVTGELEAAGARSADLEDPSNRRRTVYARISRLKLNDLLLQFDYPDANVHAESRGATTTAIQKLFFLNSPFMLERARRLVDRINREAGDDDAARVAWVYRVVFNRTPEAAESQLAREFLRRPSAGEMTRWQQYAQLLLVSNEFFYVD